MGKTMVSRTLSVHKEHELLLKLETAGLSDELAQRVIDSKGNDLATKVVRLIQNGGFDLMSGVDLMIKEKRVREIMGKNFFGVEDWATLYGVNFINKQFSEVAEFPWNEDVLNAPCPFNKAKSIKETHFAFLGLDSFKGKPLTILEWRKLYPPPDQPWLRLYYYNKYEHYTCWWAGEKFAEQLTCHFRWYLMPLEIVSNSTDKTYQEQTAMLSQGYEVPLAIEELTKLMLYYRKNGIYLNSEALGRCRDVSSVGARVHVGFFSSSDLYIGNWRDGEHSSNLGLAVARKF